MTSTLDPLLEATRLLAAAWGDASSGAGLSRAQLVVVNEAIGSARRCLDAVHAEVAAGIAHESRPELGPESLAKQQGFRTTAQLIATTTGATTGDAARLVRVGEATAPRTNLIGESLPAKFPAVREALSAGGCRIRETRLAYCRLPPAYPGGISGHGRRDDRQHALLAQQDARRDDRGGVGIALRRLRSLLPGQARGRGYREDPRDRYRLPPVRCRDLPLP